MPDRTPKPNTKPLKPYRRGETLSKDSRAGRTPKAQLSKGKSVGGPRDNAERRERETEWKGIVEDESGEDMREDEDEEGADEDESEEEEEEVQVEPRRDPKKPRLKEKKPKGKKGKKFLDNDAMLSLVASIAGATEAKKAQKAQKSKPKKKPVPEAVQKSQREAVKKQELDLAKAVVSAKAKESKDRKMGNAKRVRGAAVEGVLEEGKKRVSFA